MNMHPPLHHMPREEARVAVEREDRLQEALASSASFVYSGRQMQRHTSKSYAVSFKTSLRKSLDDHIQEAVCTALHVSVYAYVDCAYVIFTLVTYSVARIWIQIDARRSHASGTTSSRLTERERWKQLDAHVLETAHKAFSHGIVRANDLVQYIQAKHEMRDVEKDGSYASV